jgi:calcium-dependent protein kinase
MSKAERNELAEKFKSIDKDGSGMLDKEELTEAYKTIYGMVNEEAISHIIDTIDVNGSGKIDFTEFVVAASNRDKLFHRKALEQAFEYFDHVHIVVTQDKTGFI